MDCGSCSVFVWELCRIFFVFARQNVHIFSVIEQFQHHVFEVSSALKEGSTTLLNSLVAQIASVKCASNPLEEAAEDQTEESDGNGSD